MQFNSKQLKEMSNAAIAGALGAIRSAKSGHVGIVLGAANIITTIYANHLRCGIDKFVLSAGHGSALLYSILKLAGYKIGELDTFRKIGGLPGHPEFGTDGVDATAGPLGQGVGNAVGIALAYKIRNPKSEIRNVYCLCGDGDLSEGVANESIVFAGRYKLNNLVLLWDDNGITMDGIALTDINVSLRMRAAGFNVITIRGNNFGEINRALESAKKSKRPTFIQCKTTIGVGSSVAGKPAAHGLAIDDGESERLIKKHTNVSGAELWKKCAICKPQSANNKSAEKISKSAFQISRYPVASTRELSGEYLMQLVKENPQLIGGAADVAQNTNTKTSAHRNIMPDDFSGNFIEYGVREFAMGAIMNGITSVGLRAYGGCFLAFSDYMRGAIRLAALSKIPTIFVFTHDSIAVGEDGPTHQPVEQIASLRLIPNLNVFRPCNADEVKWAWDTALADTARPSCIILSRQKFKQAETPKNTNLNNGAYIIYPSPINRKPSTITLIATGSEVPLAVAVAEKLGNANVISMPAIEIFRAQPESYKNKILSGTIIAIEAGATAPWFEFADAVIGTDTFGTSGAGDAVYKHFGFDADAIVAEIQQKIK